MQKIQPLTIAFIITLGFGIGCGESGNTQANANGGGISIGAGAPSGPADATVVAVPPPFQLVAFAETDRDLYITPDIGVATFENTTDQPLFLPGCAPFEFDRRLDGEWVAVGPPFVCVWEGFAVFFAPLEFEALEFNVPSESGLYRLRYDHAVGCELDQPLSQANCDEALTVYSNVFEVTRELCDPRTFGCQFLPGAPIHLCPDGIAIGGPSDECTLDPVGGICGYEMLECS